MDMKQMAHKIIGESWSEKELICCLVNLQRAHKHTLAKIIAYLFQRSCLLY